MTKKSVINCGNERKGNNMNDFSQEEIERFRQRLAAEQRRSNVEAMTHQAAPVKPVSSTPQARMYDPKTGTIGGEVNPLLRALLGAGAGAQNVITNIGEMTGVLPTEQAVQRLEQNRPFTQGPAGATGEFIGETAALPFLTSPAGRAVSTGAKLLGYGGPVTKAVVEGGLSGAITADPGQRKEGAFFGAGTATAVPVVGGTYKALTQGIDATDSARNLARRGVTLTPGQTEPDSNWAMLEESMMGTPFIGPRVTAAREQGWRETQGVIAQEAAPPGFTITPKENLQDMMSDLEAAYTQAYDVAKGFPMSPVIMRTQGANQPLVNILPVPANAPVKPASRNYVNKWLSGEIKILMDRSRSGQLSSDDILEMRSRVRQKIRDLRTNPNTDLFEADDLLEGAENKLTQAIESQLPPDASAALRAVDAKYVNKKVLEGAMFRAMNRPEGFTPSQFAQEVRAATQSRGQYARGGGPMRDISMEASDIFTDRQPKTGRQIPGQIAGYAAGALTYPLYGQSPASRLARQLMTGGVPAQQAVQAMEEKFKRKLSAKEREALISVLRAGAGVYGEETRPTPFAATAEPR